MVLDIHLLIYLFFVEIKRSLMPVVLDFHLLIIFPFVRAKGVQELTNMNVLFELVMSNLQPFLRALNVVSMMTLSSKLLSIHVIGR